MGSVPPFFPVATATPRLNPPTMSPSLAQPPIVGAAADSFARLADASPAIPAAGFKAQIIPPPAGLSLGSPTSLMMCVQDAATGLPLQNLEVVHEKPVHMFIVSQDLSEFQHVHPELISPGLLEIPATFKKAGPYTVFAQFKPAQQPEQTVTSSFKVPGPSMPVQPLRLDATLPKICFEPDRTGALQAYTYQVSQLPSKIGQPVQFKVHILKNGLPVEKVDPFLGAAGHAVLVSANHQSFIHAHAMNGPMPGMKHASDHPPMTMSNDPSTLVFESDKKIERPGVYKAWVQTQIDGRVKTVDWTFLVPGY
jgi:hypothetical protein